MLSVRYPPPTPPRRGPTSGPADFLNFPGCIVSDLPVGLRPERFWRLVFWRTSRKLPAMPY
jgi:hypothetical protein